MSEIRVNKVIDEAGTGAVELTQGATIPTGKTLSGAGSISIGGDITATGNVTASREIRYNHSTGKWEFTEDGSTFKNLGSGGMGFSYFCGSF